MALISYVNRTKDFPIKDFIGVLYTYKVSSNRLAHSFFIDLISFLAYSRGLFLS